MGFLLADAATHWTTMWGNMFHPDVWFGEKILRSILIYVFLLAGIRLGGKRELAQLNAFDLIVLLLLSNTVQNAIIGNDNSLVGGCIGAATLLVINYIMVRFIHKHRKLDRLLEGRPEVLIRDGKIEKQHLERELITKAELVAAAHKQGIGSLHDVDRCVLEPNGTITFIQKRPTPENARHDEIMAALSKMAEEIRILRGNSPAGGAP
jgi:uncharacterized membrane protein YcaP (DUF421 family)